MTKFRIIPTKENTDLVNISNNFLEFFKTEEGNFNTDLSIHAGRIVMKIMSDLREDAYNYTNNINGYRTLFDQDLDSEFNSYASFKFKTSEISKSKNTVHVKNALDYLSNYDLKWREAINEKGIRVNTKVGFISNPTFSSGYIAFNIPKYWLTRLLDNKSFNKMLYDLVFKIKSNKHYLFNIWLLTLKPSGTKIKLETINQYFFQRKGV